MFHTGLYLFSSLLANTTNITSVSFPPTFSPVLVPLPKPLPFIQPNGKLIASNGKSFDHFGHRIASDGNIVFITTATPGGVGNIVYIDSDVWPTSNGSIVAAWYEKGRVAHIIPPYDMDSNIITSNGTLFISFPKDSSPIRNGGSVSIYSNTLLDPAYKVAQKLTCSVPNAQFGYSIDVFEDILVVGAKGEKSSSNPNLGRAYIYVNIYNSWSLLVKLAPTQGGSQAQFGHAVSIFDDIIAISAPGDSTHNPLAGAVFIYEIEYLDSGGFSEVVLKTIIQPKDLSPFSNFGENIYFSKERALITAYDSRNYTNCVYVFGKVTYTQIIDDEESKEHFDWVWLQTIYSPSTIIDDSFGASLYLYQDHIAVIGAPASLSYVNEGKGTVYVYGSFDTNITGTFASNNQIRSTMNQTQVIAIDENNQHLESAKSVSHLSLSSITFSEKWKLLKVMTSKDKSIQTDNYGISLAEYNNSLLIGADLGYGATNYSGVVYIEKDFFLSIGDGTSAKEIKDSSNNIFSTIYHFTQRNLALILGLVLPSVLVGGVIATKYTYDKCSITSNNVHNDLLLAHNDGNATKKHKSKSIMMANQPDFSQTFSSSQSNQDTKHVKGIFRSRANYIKRDESNSTDFHEAEKNDEEGETKSSLWEAARYKLKGKSWHKRLPVNDDKYDVLDPEIGPNIPRRSGDIDSNNSKSSYFPWLSSMFDIKRATKQYSSVPPDNDRNVTVDASEVTNSDKELDITDQYTVQV